MARTTSVSVHSTFVSIAIVNMQVEDITKTHTVVDNDITTRTTHVVVVVVVNEVDRIQTIVVSDVNPLVRCGTFIS